MRLIESNSPILWTPAQPVHDVTLEVKPHVGEIYNLLVDLRGRALAAPQLGMPLRFFVDWNCEAFINPTWSPTLQSLQVEGEERCLSKPDFRRKVLRWSSIKVAYTSLDGTEMRGCFVGRDAAMFQHECDHLDGRCIFPRP